MGDPKVTSLPVKEHFRAITRGPLIPPHLPPHQSLISGLSVICKVGSEP